MPNPTLTVDVPTFHSWKKEAPVIRKVILVDVHGCQRSVNIPSVPECETCGLPLTHCEGYGGTLYRLRLRDRNTTPLDPNVWAGGTDPHICDNPDCSAWSDVDHVPAAI